MKTLRLLLIVCGGLTFSACYDFDFPLDPTPRVPVDGRLVGVWRCLAIEMGSDEPGGVVRISRQTEHLTHWRFEPVSKGEADETEDETEYEVHGSTVKGGQLLSAKETKPGPRFPSKDWNFVRYTFLLPDVMRLQLVKNEPFKKVEENAVALRKEVEKRRGDTDIYEDYMVCVRTKPSEAPSPTPTPGL